MGLVLTRVCCMAEGFPSDKGSQMWQPILPLTLGAGLLWHNVAKPFLRKKRIRANNPASQELKLFFLSEGIQIQAEGIGTFKRAWDELAATLNAKKGCWYIGQMEL